MKQLHFFKNHIHFSNQRKRIKEKQKIIQNQVITKNSEAKKSGIYKKNMISEKGRTMTEMLGVLAVVGVLTVGAIWGLPWAMDKYRAVKTVEDVRLRALECAGQLVNHSLCDLGDFDEITSQGYEWSLGINLEERETFDITLHKVQMGVCKKIATLGWSTPQIFIGNIGPITSANCAEENDMMFVFSSDFSKLSSDEAGDCPPGVETVCPEGYGKNCSGSRAWGYCGCRQCYPCEGYTGSGYLTTCREGRMCKSGGCVCNEGGCPEGQSNSCPDGASWIDGGTDKCGDQCYICQASSETCVPSCPSGSDVNCQGAVVNGGSCGATCRACLPCEGFSGTTYKQLCPTGSRCTAEGCVCGAGGCPEGEKLKCETGYSWVKGGKDSCGNQCYGCVAGANCDCKNGGQCEEGVCQCVYGWSGSDCSECSGVENLKGHCCPVGTTVCNDECCEEGMRCDDALKKCVPTACPNNEPVYQDGTCPDNLCKDNTQCRVGYACYHGKCMATACREDADCIDPKKPKCRQFPDPTKNECVAVCKTPTTWEGNCPCNTDQDCLDENGKPLTGNAKYCYFAKKLCVECRADSDCSSGFCERRAFCMETVACTPGSYSVTEERCLGCREAGNELEWNGWACCPTDTNTLTPFSGLIGTNCERCGGVINEAGVCVKLVCPADVSATTDGAICQRCGGLWRCNTVDGKQICVCTKGGCQTNADCKANQYCGGATSHLYPTNNTCKNATHTCSSIQYNGQSEVWCLFPEKMVWWDAVNACKSIGKRLQPKEVVFDRWKILGERFGSYHAWTNSSSGEYTHKIAVILTDGSYEQVFAGMSVYPMLQVPLCR